MIYSSLLLFILVMTGCNAFYDGTNEDPELADPLFSISCSGPDPPFKIVLDGTEYTPPSIQSLCAQTQYGGGPPERNAGGFCPLLTREPRFGEDDKPELHDRAVQFYGDFAGILNGGDTLVNDRIRSIRIEAYCVLRCICSSVVEDRRAKPKLRFANEASGTLFDTLYILGRLPFVALELLDTQYPARTAGLQDHASNLQFLTTSDVLLFGPSSDRVDIPTYIRKSRLPYDESDFVNHDLSDVLLTRAQNKKPYTIEDANRIICDEVWPAGWTLPAPARREDFNHLLEICAVGLSGGNL
jgi:hypothetical protein